MLKSLSGSGGSQRISDIQRTGPATVSHNALYHSSVNKGMAGSRASEQRQSYGKYFSPKDMAPDVQRLMGAIIGGQGSGCEALLSQAAIQHLQLIKLSRVAMIKTKERSRADLRHCARAGIFFSSAGLNEDILHLQVGFDEMALQQRALVLSLPLLFCMSERLVQIFKSLAFFFLLHLIEGGIQRN